MLILRACVGAKPPRACPFERVSCERARGRAAQLVAFGIWLLVYLLFVILSLILLLNLLIAMLSFTFESVRSESTLQCRTSFAQTIMRLELYAGMRSPSQSLTMLATMRSNQLIRPPHLSA